MIQAYKSKQGIGFRIHSDTFQETVRWSSLVDETVFKEQLATGRFRGHEIAPGILAVMKQAQNSSEKNFSRLRKIARRSGTGVLLVLILYVLILRIALNGI